MKYVIHTYPKRLWYVKDYIVKDMIKQGIKKEDIIILNDKNKLGNLMSFVESCEMLNEDCWHLQDDVLLSSKFRDKTEVLGRLNMLVSGFCCYEFNDGAVLCNGFTTAKFLYMTFPCIFIPIRYMKEFVNWFYLDSTQERFKEKIETKKNDDLLFYNYLMEYHKRDEIYNCKECLVDHVDYLIGGSLVNKERGLTKATYWYETNLNKELEKRLKNDKD